MRPAPQPTAAPPSLPCRRPPCPACFSTALDAARAASPAPTRFPTLNLSGPRRRWEASNAAQQVPELPRWVQWLLRMPGGMIILALIVLPLTLVRCREARRPACSAAALGQEGARAGPRRAGPCAPAWRPPPMQRSMLACPLLATYQSPQPTTSHLNPPPNRQPARQILLAIGLALFIICLPINICCRCLGCAPPPPPPGAHGGEDATKAAGTGMTQVRRGGGRPAAAALLESLLDAAPTLAAFVPGVLSLPHRVPTPTWRTSRLPPPTWKELVAGVAHPLPSPRSS